MRPIYIPMTVSGPSPIPMSIAASIVVPPGSQYEGPYAVTPAQEAQTLATEGLVMIGDIVVKPIPSNYGRIAWNGVTLTVY